MVGGSGPGGERPGPGAGSGSGNHTSNSSNNNNNNNSNNHNGGAGGGTTTGVDGPQARAIHDWEEALAEADGYSFDDSDRFEEDSLCSWSSEAESLINHWRGWRRLPAGFGISKKSEGQFYFFNFYFFITGLCNYPFFVPAFYGCPAINFSLQKIPLQFFFRPLRTVIVKIYIFFNL